MPDDPILSPEPVVGSPAGSPMPQNSAAPATPATPSLTRDDVAQMLTGALSPIQQSLTALAQTREPPTPIDQSEEDFANEFYKAPKSTMQRFIQEAARPLVAAQAEATGTTILNEMKAEVESRFGPGAYEKFYAPKIDPVIAEQKRIDPTVLLNRSAIQNAFDSITGKRDILDQLLAHREAHQKSTKDADETQYGSLRDRMFAEMGNLTGGIRRSDKPALTEEHRQILREMNKATGETADENLLAHVMSAGDTIDDYRAAKKKSLNGGGKEARQ